MLDVHKVNKVSLGRELQKILTANDINPDTTGIYRVLGILSPDRSRDLMLLLSNEEKMIPSAFIAPACKALGIPLEPKAPAAPIEVATAEEVRTEANSNVEAMSEAQKQLNQACPSAFSNLSTVGKLQVINRLFSPVMQSNLYTMLLASELDPRQSIPEAPSEPEFRSRSFRLGLCFEEAGFELAEGLGLRVRCVGHAEPISLDDLVFEETGTFDWEKAVDACVDGIYVLCGTLAKLGAADVPHMQHVCDKNNAKFPNGQGVRDPSRPGKFGKPAGWTPPDHIKVVKDVRARSKDGRYPNLKEAAETLVAVSK